MHDLNLGQIITTEQNRDAVHVAVAPVIAAETLQPGQHVGFKGQEIGSVRNPIGVVDPFLTESVSKGQRFWLFLYPNTIKSLRHEWEHPAFSRNSESEEWIRDFARGIGLDYSYLIEATNKFLDFGEDLYLGDREEYLPEEFWPHFERATGRLVPTHNRGDFFRCSC